jgi:ABC-type transport system involved in cytochrome c biogenesis permease component
MRVYNQAFPILYIFFSLQKWHMPIMWLRLLIGRPDKGKIVKERVSGANHSL